MTTPFKNDHVECTILMHGPHVKVSGQVRNPSEFKEMVIIAATPVDRMTSYSGSGLPWPCPNIAFDNTPNKATINQTGAFDVTFDYPNSYYSNDMLQRVGPSVFFILQRSMGDPAFVRIPLQETHADILPLRTLTHRPGRTGPEFYAKKDALPPMTAEQVMLTIKEYKAKYDIA